MAAEFYKIMAVKIIQDGGWLNALHLFSNSYSSEQGIDIYSGDTLVKKLFRLLILGIVLVSILPLSTQASRRASVFTYDLKRAELVVQGEVVDSWYAEPLGIGRASRVRVDHCFKGGREKGLEVVVWDKHGSVPSKNGGIRSSTASWNIRDRSEYIAYLIPAELSEYEQKQINPDGLTFYTPCRMIRRSDSFNWKEPSVTSPSYTRELRLLDLFVVNPPQDKRLTYQELLEREEDPGFLTPLLMDWPEPLTEKDATLFLAKLAEPRTDESLSRELIRKLLRTSVLGDEELLMLLKNGGSRQLRELKKRITSDNIGSIQELLFQWVREGDLAGGFRDAVEILAGLSPEYLKAQLRANELPRWIFISCLAKLGINGSDVGRENYSAELRSKELDPHTLRSFDEFVQKQNLFFAQIALNDPVRHAEWRVSFSLFTPILAGADTPQRRLAVALLRTHGVPVERVGTMYISWYDPMPVACPVELEISVTSKNIVLGEPVRLTVCERAVRDADSFCFQGRIAYTIRCEERGRGLSPATIGADIWNNVDVPQEAMVQLRKGMVNQTVSEISAERFRLPGTYRISAVKCYPHDGGNLGMDAWTGVVSSKNELIVEVVEPNRPRL